MTTYRHPQFQLNRLIQYGAMAVVILLLITIPLQFILAVTIGSAFFLSALLTLLLAAPVLMLTAYTPAVTIREDGLTIHPIIWKEHDIPWERVTAVKVYPLLPSEYSEVTRRIAVGRLNYRPADGIMLVIPELPFQYRIAGFFAGERAAPIIALTNRAHTDYDRLYESILQLTDSAIHDEELKV